MKKTTKDVNPKDTIGGNKMPMHLWPATATATVMGCIGMLNGAFKYGRSNFRRTGVRASINIDAAKRRSPPGRIVLKGVDSNRGRIHTVLYGDDGADGGGVQVLRQAAHGRGVEESPARRRAE